MSEISETQSKLDELMNEYEVAVIGENRGRNRSGYSEKADKYYQKRRELKEFVAKIEAAQRWIPVSERLPQIGVRVLFYNNFIKNIHKGWYSGDEWVSEIGVFYNGDKLKRITHWMPLPKFPEVQE